MKTSNQVLPSRWLRVAEAAGHAQVSTDTIYDACLTGQLQHARVSGRRSIRILAEWVDQWLLRTAQAAPDLDDLAA